MTNPALEKFVMGTADEAETRLAEDVLNQSETVKNAGVESTLPDSLLVALRGEDIPQEELEAARQLAERIEQLAPRPEMSTDELRALLDPIEKLHALGCIGKYHVTQYLASGGMGLVFRATDVELEREVCIKLLNPHRARAIETRQRFEREARAAARINCERIVPVLDVGVHRELPFLVMPLLEGSSLRTHLLREGQISVTQGVQLARQIAEGLDYAHRQGILHRDIKPDNLWITLTGDVKILDFGLARAADDTTPITQEGTVIGTPSYMSPEQVTGKPLDGRSDLFSLGVVLLEMLTGESPFRKTNVFSTMMSVAADELHIDELDTAGRIPVELRDLLRQLLRKNPAERPQSAGELVKRLKSIETGSVTVDSKRWPPRSGSSRSSYRRLIAAALGGFAVCLASLAVWQMNDKGTLVVETNDPQVQIRIADERVIVTDPLSGRTHEIHIGATPLPSGVYHLELSDHNNELIFSSQTIAIRRGERTIVTVELRPSSDPTAQSQTAGLAEPPPSVGLIPVPRSEIVDASFDPQARELFGETLAKLPAKSEELNLPGGAIGAGVTVDQPRPLPGISSWTLERPPVIEGWRRNVDGTLFAGGEDLVWIRDAEGQTRYVLPSRGSLTSFQFDNRYPNLIATVARLGDPHQPLGSPVGSRPDYEIRIWRLSDSAAELIHTTRSSTWRIAWDQGYRLVHELDDHIVAFRLDNGETYPLLNTLDSQLMVNSISPGGRFLAARSVSDRSQVINIYDLHRGVFSLATRQNGNIQWRVDDSEIAICSTKDGHLTVWRTDQPTLLRQMEPSRSQADNRGNSPRYHDIALDATLQRVFLLSPDGRFVVRSFMNNRESEMQLGSLNIGSQARLRWTREGQLSIIQPDAEYVWEETDSEVHGTLRLVHHKERQKEVLHARPPQVPGLARVEFQQGSRIILRQDLTNIRPDSFSSYSILGGGGDALAGGFVDDAAMGVWQSHFSERNIDCRGDQSMAHFQVDQQHFKGFSPDAQYYVRQRYVPQQQNTRSDELERFELVRVANHEVVLSVDLASARSFRRLVSSAMPRVDWARARELGLRTSIHHAFVWSADSGLLLVYGIKPAAESSETTFVFEIWDVRRQLKLELETQKHLNLNHARLMVSAFACQNGFLVEILDVQGQRQLFLIDPRQPAPVVGIAELEETNAQRLTHVSGEFLFFLGDQSTGDRQWIRTELSGNQLVRPLKMVAKPHEIVLISPTGEHYLKYPSPGTRYPDGMGARGLMDLDSSQVTGLTVRRWSSDQATDLVFEILQQEWPGYANMEPVWHRKATAIALIGRTGNDGVLFLDLSTKKAKSLIFPQKEPLALFPTDFGWFLSRPGKIVAFSLTGDLLGTWHWRREDASDESPELYTRAYWLLADGSRHNGSGDDELYFIYRTQHQHFATALRTFSAAPNQPSLPTFDTLPFALE